MSDNLFGDRVLETSTTTGTGTYSLAGALGGYQAFLSTFDDGDTVIYFATDGTDWERGIGTLTDGDPDTLSRDTILGSSNAGSAVNWTSGTRSIFSTPAADVISSLARTNRGTSRPAWLKKGIWADAISSPVLLKYYDGAADITLGAIDESANTFTPYRHGTAATDAMTNALLSGIATVGQAEAEAGTATTARLWTAERVKQAIDANLVTADETARNNIALLALRQADDDGEAFGMVDGYVDAFADETDVDTATATNEVYDAAGDYYTNTASQTLIAQATGTVIGNMTGGGGNAVAFDGDNNQSSGAANRSATSGYVGKDWGVGNSYTLTGVKVWGRNDAGYSDGGASVTIAVYGSDAAPASATDGTLLATVVTGLADANNANPQEKLSGFDIDTAYRYHWAAVTNGSGNVYFAEVEFYETPAPTDMVLQNNAYTADAAPATGRLVIDHEAIDSVTLNTDLTAEISRDGGTTWTTATLAQETDLGSGRQILAGSADLSGQPSGTSMKWRLKTFNDKEQRIHGVSLRWDA